MNALAGVGGWIRATGGVLVAVLANPSLRRVLVAYLLYVSVEWGTWVAIMLWAADTLGTAQMGLVAIAQLLPAAGFAAAAATLADRYPRRRLLPTGYAAQGVGFGAAGIGMLSGWPPVLVIVLLAAATSAMTLARPSQGALLPELARTPAEATAANALASTVEGVGVLAGPLVTAAILFAGPAGGALLAGGAASGLAAVLVARLAPPREAPAALPARDGSHGGAVEVDRAAPDDQFPAPADAHGHGRLAGSGPFHRVAHGLRAMAGSADVTLVVGALGLRMLVSGMLDILVVLIAIDMFGLGGSAAAALEASFGLGTILGGAASVSLIGRRRLSLALLWSALLLGAPLVAFGLFRPTLVAPVLLGAGGIGFAMVDVAGRTILQRVADPARLASVLASLEGISFVALSAGSVAAPALVDTVGLPAAIVITGVVLPAGLGAAWIWLRRVDRRASIPVREIALLRANPIFAPLPAPQLEAAADRVQWLTLAAGSTLIREGDPGDRYYVLAEGSLRVTRGGELLAMVDRPGLGVGEIALLRGVVRTATVSVDAPAVVLAIDRSDFLTVITGNAPAYAAGRRIADEYAGPEPTQEDATSPAVSDAGGPSRAAPSRPSAAR